MPPKLTYAIKFVADMDRAIRFHRDTLGLHYFGSTLDTAADAAVRLGDEAKLQEVLGISGILLVTPEKITMAQVKNTTTVVRNAVATFESTPSTPTFARIAVNAAKNAEPSAQ